MCLLLPTMMGSLSGSLSRSFIILPKSLSSAFLIVGCFTDTFDKVFCSGEVWNAPVLTQIHNSALYFCLHSGKLT